MLVSAATTPIAPNIHSVPEQLPKCKFKRGESEYVNTAT